MTPGRPHNAHLSARKATSILRSQTKVQRQVCSWRRTTVDPPDAIKVGQNPRDVRMRPSSPQWRSLRRVSEGCKRLGSGTPGLNAEALRCLLLALLGPCVMSDLSPECDPKRTFERSKIAMYAS